MDGAFNAGVDERSNYAFAAVTAVQSDGKIVAGGDFTSINGDQTRGYLTRLNTNGTTDNSFNVGGSGPSSAVFDIVILPDGRILIAGGFTRYNGISLRGIARLNPDGTFDSSFNAGGTGALGTIHTIVVQPDGKILISGENFRSYNGVTLNSIARLNADGTLDSSFTSPFAGQGYAEEVDLAPDGKIYVSRGGDGTNGLGVTRLNSDGSIDTTYNAAPLTDLLYAMALQPDGKLLIGGNFRAVGGVDRQGIARLNQDGSLDTTFVPPVYTVSSTFDNQYADYIVLRPNGQILVAGNYDYSTGLNHTLTRLNADGSKDQSFVVLADYSSWHVNVLADGNLLCAGAFSRFMPGMGHAGLARFSSNGVIDNTFNPSLASKDGLINETIVQPDGKILVAGQFGKANGSYAPEIARFNPDGSLDTSFSLGLGPFYDEPIIGITALALQPDGKILVGGCFKRFNDSLRNSFVRLNLDGTLDNSFTFPSYIGVSGLTEYSWGNGIADIYVQADGKILVTGTFGFPTSPTFRILIRLNADGSEDTSFITSNAGFTLSQNSGHKLLIQPDQKIVVVGYLRTVNPSATYNVVRFNPDGSRDTSFTPPRINSSVSIPVSDIILQPDGKMVLVGGPYNLANAYISRINANGTADFTFNPGTGPDLAIYSTAVQPDGKILIGGAFSQYAGVPRNGFARLNSDGSLDTTFNPAFNISGSQVNSLRFQPDGKLLVGGIFREYAGTVKKNFLRLSPSATGKTGFDYDGDRKADLSVYRPSNGLWYVDRSAGGGLYAAQLGNATDKIVPGDYDNDGKTDFAVYRPSSGAWYVLKSSTNVVDVTVFGLAADVPAPGDYDGDGRADVAVFRPSDGTWYVQRSTQGLLITQFGANGDVPAPGDYDGDGKNDLVVWRPSNGVWFERRSTGSDFAIQFGASTDKIVPADYDGDGKTDVGVYRASPQGTWYTVNSSNGAYPVTVFGLANDIPVPADYDGDGRADIGLFRPSDRTWYVNRTTSGLLITQFGLSGDRPTENAFGN